MHCSYKYVAVITFVRSIQLRIRITKQGLMVIHFFILGPARISIPYHAYMDTWSYIQTTRAIIVILLK